MQMYETPIFRIGVLFFVNLVSRYFVTVFLLFNKGKIACSRVKQTKVYYPTYTYFFALQNIFIQYIVFFIILLLTHN